LVVDLRGNLLGQWNKGKFMSNGSLRKVQRYGRNHRVRNVTGLPKSKRLNEK